MDALASMLFPSHLSPAIHHSRDSADIDMRVAPTGSEQCTDSRRRRRRRLISFLSGALAMRIYFMQSICSIRAQWPTDVSLCARTAYSIRFISMRTSSSSSSPVTRRSHAAAATANERFGDVRGSLPLSPAASLLSRVDRSPDMSSAISTGDPFLCARKKFPSNVLDYFKCERHP